MRQPLRISIAALVAGICLYSPSQPAGAATFSCGSVSCLVAAIERAQLTPESDTITLTAPVFTFTAVDNTSMGPTALPLVTTEILIQGSNKDERAQFVRDPSAQCFRFFAVSKGGRLILRDMELARGCAREGGAILSRQASVELSRVRFVSNSAEHGGAIDLEDGSLLAISNEYFNNGMNDERATGGAVKLMRATAVFNLATFTANDAFPGLGGAIAAMQDTTVDFNGVVQGNRARHGGGLWVQDSNLRVSGARITNNRAILSGGGIQLTDGSTLDMSSSTVAFNRTGPGPSFGGGGIALIGPPADRTSVIRNSAIFGNQTSRRGGGLEVSASLGGEHLRIINSTIANNSAEHGGGIAMSQRARVLLLNATVARNAADIGDALASFDFAFAFAMNTIIGNDGFGTEASNCWAELGPVAVRAAVSWGFNIGEDGSCDLTQFADRQSLSAGLGLFTSTAEPGRGFFPIGLGGPAVNAGNTLVCATTPDLSRDQLRKMRDDGHCDIGAIEFRLDVLEPLLSSDRFR